MKAFLKSTWFEAYEFVEFFIGKIEKERIINNLTEKLNQVLEEENSAYRIENRIVEKKY